MLKLVRLEIENFGPFKGYQTLEFPESGVVIVYGENMRGKTRLLNAVRYALFGKVLSRGAREESLLSIGNWESAKEGQFGFSVKLYVENDSSEYVLTRSYYPKRGMLMPTDERDYEENFFLKRDGILLGPDQRDLEVAQIMPEQVSRFFLFDGELLQEYEELLRDDSNMGAKITQAIERILGLPILTNARADLRQLHRDAQKEASKAAQRDQKTREMGNYLEDLTEQRRYFEQEVDRMKSDLMELEASKASLEQELRKSERVKGYLDELDEKIRSRDELKRRLLAKQDEIKSVMAEAWRGILGPKIQATLIDLLEQQNQIQQRIKQRTLVEEIQQAISFGVCGICGQPVLDEVARRLADTLYELQMDNEDESDVQDLQKLTIRIQFLQQFSAYDKVEIVAEKSENINDLLIQLSVTEDRIEELRGYVENYDHSEIRALYSEHDKVVKEIGEVERGLVDLDSQIKKLNDDIRRLEVEIRRLSGADPSRETRKSELYLALYRLFEEGVDIYRDRLRAQVEGDATELFRRLTSEPEYNRLLINENYGLKIIHNDGGEIPVRSAGAEHIVALSLMGALQRNAPLRGPIIMDSPFGRLDAAHTANVIRSLPNMAEQVLLLVYRSELDPVLAREILGGNLKTEYKLDRQSARHTVLTANVE